MTNKPYLHNIGQPYGDEATRFAEQKLLDKKVSVKLLGISYTPYHISNTTNLKLFKSLTHSANDYSILMFILPTKDNYGLTLPLPHSRIYPHLFSPPIPPPITTAKDRYGLTLLLPHLTYISPPPPPTSSIFISVFKRAQRVNLRIILLLPPPVTTAKDRYGRALASVRYKDQGLLSGNQENDISAELLKLGLAVVYRQGRSLRHTHASPLTYPLICPLD